jgi:hypothetical protein
VNNKIKAAQEASHSRFYSNGGKSDSICSILRDSKCISFDARLSMRLGNVIKTFKRCEGCRLPLEKGFHMMDFIGRVSSGEQLGGTSGRRGCELYSPLMLQGRIFESMQGQRILDFLPLGDFYTLWAVLS